MSQESLDIVRQLVAVVARTFYKDEYIIALDYLNRHEIARSDVLHKYLHVMPREMGRIYGELEKHKLVCRVKRRDEQAENSPYQRKSAQIYFYLDYKQFVDVVKWRMWMLREQVVEKIKKEQQELGYECPRCSRRYNAFAVLSLADEETGVFKCDYCGEVLVDKMSSELSHKSQKELSDFMDQFQTIIDLLRKTDSITLPPPTPLSEVPVPNLNGDSAGDIDGKGRQGMGKGLSVARDTGISSGDTVIAFASDLSAEDAARVREIELSKKLQQNALPAWHIWSTVSGVQMVVDQKITAEARIVHTRYVERQIMRKNRWNKRERDRARAVVKDMEEQLRSIANGRSDPKEALESQLDGKSEEYYSEYYLKLAQRAGIAIPDDPRKNYQRLLDQLAKDEELEQAEAEKRKQEMERIEKERKEAAAAQSADRNSGNSYRYHNKFNSHHHYNKYNRNSHRHIRKATHRLFEFVGAELDGTANSADKSSKSKSKSNKEDTVPIDTSDNQKPNDDNALDDANGANGDVSSDSGTDGVANHDAEVPDPFLEGIYALSKAKRRKLGLDGSVSVELADSVPDSIVIESPSHVPNVEIYIKGRPKPMAEVTSQDEGDMTLEEYTNYWNAWHQEQPALS
ncbi:hypothetical protein GGI25_000984 [Coemansia spiralis]|uniref:Transcription initiation factor IIE subunit alpha N-terminal domain-containing protein n=2 Tax=Coemansia TaxID=4863 RepID=A0A9W8GBM3_9FUNG|nr:hypothetical protein BX070DRAFT_220218 [Coemansia spiralis]KAJ1993841.1 hypothetical protein EDC05_002002 [Coemansia umbellata]KAJ2623217.1 hypothetical protein GGI26_002632 [Coemansia sp. RSA 1358]KAJ2680095.1 hypothetical protein GGI25_000984 [Coemansia spiralis]